MEIREKKEYKLIEVWLTNEECLTIKRDKLAEQLLSDVDSKYKVVFFLSGKSDLLDCTKQLLVHNVQK